MGGKKREAARRRQEEGERVKRRTLRDCVGTQEPEAERTGTAGCTGLRTGSHPRAFCSLALVPHSFLAAPSPQLCSGGSRRAHGAAGVHCVQAQAGPNSAPGSGGAAGRARCSLPVTGSSLEIKQAPSCPSNDKNSQRERQVRGGRRKSPAEGATGRAISKRQAQDGDLSIGCVRPPCPRRIPQLGLLSQHKCHRCHLAGSGERLPH